jgi:hypothetical protein
MLHNCAGVTDTSASHVTTLSFYSHHKRDFIFGLITLKSLHLTLLLSP